MSLAEVISEVTGKVWNHSDEESSEDEGNGIHAYLGAQFFDWGAVESLGAAIILPTYASAVADGDGPYLMGRTQMRKVSQICEDLAVVLAC